MIFLSAQPDDYFFLWQLQLQLYNFRCHGINDNSVHILVGYNEERGIQRDYLKFANECPEVNVCFYCDTRKDKSYLPSIRPHIIKKHFCEFPELKLLDIFYHDSDILFKDLPEFDKLIKQQDKWFASDTQSYLSCRHIIRAAGRAVFEGMCKIVGITPQLLIDNDSNAGGAQYILRNTTSEFWEKIEFDSTQIFKYLEKENLIEKTEPNADNKREQLQSWCADMWAIWWNAVLIGKHFRIAKELDFAWADDDISKLDHCRILHYTGTFAKDNPKRFRKGEFYHHSPFTSDLSKISNRICSFYLKKNIDNYQDEKKIDLKDVSFLIYIRIDSESRLDNLYCTVRNLHSNFHTNIFVHEVDNEPKVDNSRLPAGVNYTFETDDNPRLHHTRHTNTMILRAATPYIVLYDADVILPVQQIEQAVDIIRRHEFSAVSPYDGTFLNVDSLMKALFIKIQDADLFEENFKKLKVISRRSYGGAIFLNKKDYTKAGLDNENLLFWGPNDIERVKRLKILGFKIKRIPGNLYHLDHFRGLNTGYQTYNEHIMLIAEYLKICNMDRHSLQQYIASWKWGQDEQLIKGNGN